MSDMRLSSPVSTPPAQNSSVSQFAEGHFSQGDTVLTNSPLASMRDVYMKNGQGFLLVFSITSPSSLNELYGLREEILRIKDRDHVPIVIIGNKADLEDQRNVPRTKAFAISQQWGAPYYEASARTRSEHKFPWWKQGPTIEDAKLTKRKQQTLMKYS